MDIQNNGAHMERVDFSKIKTSIPIPNLIEVQKKSYERFLQMDLLPNEREDIGLQTVFNSVFPIDPGAQLAEHTTRCAQCGQPVDLHRGKAAPAVGNLRATWPGPICSTPP